MSDEPIPPVKEVRLNYWPSTGERAFERAVRDSVITLVQNFAMRGPWTVRASIELTHGIKVLHTPAGEVIVESVIAEGKARVFEVRGQW